MAEVSHLREYFYVDIDRVDSLFAQTGGEFPAGDPASRRYGDALFTRFEAQAEQMGLLSDLTEQASHYMAWVDGTLHEATPTGALIRITAPMQVMDSDSVSSALQRLFQLFQATQQAERPHSPRATRRAGVQDSDNSFSFVTDLYGALLPGGVWIRSMPELSAERAFVGSLQTNSQYLATERKSLLARYGSGAVPWTMVALVSRVATERSTTDFPDIDPFDEYGNFSPSAIEELHIQLLEMLEGFGLVGAPVWPSVAVTPLALYRPLGGYEESDTAPEAEEGAEFGEGENEKDQEPRPAKKKSPSKNTGTTLTF